MFIDAPFEVPSSGVPCADGEEAEAGTRQLGWWFTTKEHSYNPAASVVRHEGYDETVAYVADVLAKQACADCSIWRCTLMVDARGHLTACSASRKARPCSQSYAA